MTTIFLIVFAVVFYQLLIKTAFLPATPNGGQHQTQERLNLDDMWRAFQQHQQRQTGRPNTAQAQPEKKQSRFSRSKGYQGGEYIEYEEVS